MNTDFAVYAHAIGYIHIEYKDHTVTSLHVEDCRPSSFGKTNNFTDKVFSEVGEYLNGKRKCFTVDYTLEDCTDFQLSVLNEVKCIPYGEVRSYAQIATLIGKSKSYRAVGGACKRNPLLFIIPCHRVVSTNGSTGGYAAGAGLKKCIIEMENLKK